MPPASSNPFQSGRQSNNCTPATKNPFQNDPGTETLPPTSNLRKANRESEITRLQRELTTTQLTLEMTRNLRNDAEQDRQSLQKELSCMEEERSRLSSRITAQNSELDMLRDRMVAIETYAQETDDALRAQTSFMDRMNRLRDAVLPILQCNICLDEYRDAKVPTTIFCGHSFCADCLKGWVAGGSNTCPICRQSFSEFTICLAFRDLARLLLNPDI